MPGSIFKECPGCKLKIGVACKKCPKCTLTQPHKKRLTDARKKFAQEKNAWRDKNKKHHNANKEHDKAYKLVRTPSPRYTHHYFSSVIYSVCMKETHPERCMNVHLLKSKYKYCILIENIIP